MTLREVEGLGFDTRQVHAGQFFDAEHRARITPIYLSNGFLFEDFDDAYQRMAHGSEGYVYSRVSNPTNSVAEQRMASLDGGVAAVLTGSGQAAISSTILTLARAGDHVLAGPTLYEGTRSLFREQFAGLGIEFEFVDDHNRAEDWARRVRPNTKAFYAETIPNPRNQILDISKVAQVAQANGLPLIVDNTLATPYLLRPIEHGADIVLYSASKLLTGHGASIGGVIVDGGTFDWNANTSRFPQFQERAKSEEPRTYTEKHGASAFAAYARSKIIASFGPSLSPFNTFLLLQGIETLSLRVAKHVENARIVAHWLEDRPEVVSVDYSGLESNEYHPLARRYLPQGEGSIFSFTLRGGRQAAEHLINHVRLFSRMTHIGDLRSLILHPATTTHAQLTSDELAEAGIGEGLVRLSIGVETPQDLLSDLEEGLRGIPGHAAAG